MVDLSSALHGWTQNVYAFGCGFIHLSAFHDYSDRDPFDSLTLEDRRDIAHYLHYYHGVVVDHTARFRDIEFVLPVVFEKISANLRMLCEGPRSRFGLVVLNLEITNWLDLPWGSLAPILI